MGFFCMAVAMLLGKFPFVISTVDKSKSGVGYFDFWYTQDELYAFLQIYFEGRWFLVFSLLFFFGVDGECLSGIYSSFTRGPGVFEIWGYKETRGGRGGGGGTEGGECLDFPS